MEDEIVAGVKSGAVGCILLLPAAFISIILLITTFAVAFATAQIWYIIMAAVGTFILYIGVLFVSLGAMKFGNFYDNAFSRITGILGLIFAIIGLVSGILALTAGFVAGLVGISNIMNIVAAILTGVFFIMFGIALIIMRESTGLSGLSLGTGVLGIVAGSLWCSIVLGFVGLVILIPLGICAAYLFLKAGGIPGGEAKEIKVKEAKKLAVRPAEEKKPAMKPEEIEEDVLKYVRKHPEGIDVSDCAKRLGVSEKDVEKAVKALVKRGKLSMG